MRWKSGRCWVPVGGLRFLTKHRVRSKLVCSGLARICSSFCVCVSNWKPNSSVVLRVGMGWGEWKRFNTHTHTHQLYPISLFLLKAYLPPHPPPLTSYHIFTLSSLSPLLLFLFFSDCLLLPVMNVYIMSMWWQIRSSSCYRYLLFNNRCVTGIDWRGKTL